MRKAVVVTLPTGIVFCEAAGMGIGRRRKTRCRFFWCGLPKFYEHFVAVDQFSGWNRHQVWAHRSGPQLRAIMTARTASNTVFLSLLTSTEIGILFSPSDPGNLMRENLKESDYDTFAFWAGWFLSFGVLCSVCALYTNFIAWGIVVSYQPPLSDASP